MSDDNINSGSLNALVRGTGMGGDKEAAPLVLEVEFRHVGEFDKEAIRDWPRHNLDPTRRRTFTANAASAARIIRDGH